MQQKTSNNFYFQRIVLVLIILGLAAFGVTEYRGRKAAEKSVTVLSAQNTKYKLKNGQEVTSQQIAEISERQIKEAVKTDSVMTELIKQFHKLASVKTLTVKTELPKTAIAFDKPITKAEIDSVSNELKFTRSGSKFEKWYNLGYKVTQDSLTIEPFNTWTDVKIVDGFKRKWFLGKQTYTADILFTNPYMQASEVKAYQVSVPKKWHETRAVNIAFGILLKTVEESLTRK